MSDDTRLVTPLPMRTPYHAVYCKEDGTPLSAMSERALQELCQEHARYREWLAFGCVFPDTQRQPA